MCAEPVTATALLRGEACSSCQRPLRIQGEQDHVKGLLTALRSQWRDQRMMVYGVVGVAFFMAGWFPLVPGLLSAVGMAAANVLLIRRPTRWLPAGIRTTTRLLIVLWGLTLVLVNLAISVFAWIVPGLGAFVASVAGLVTSALYIEGALWAVERAVERSARMSPGAVRLAMLIPFGILGTLIVAVGTVLTAAWVVMAPMLGGAW